MEMLRESGGHWLLILTAIVILVTVASTVYAFWRKRYMDGGPRKGEAENPGRVKMQNPPTRHE